MLAGSAAVDREAVPVFAALGDEHRLSLVRRLCSGGPTSVTRLAEGAGITRQGVSKHLRVLEGAGLVRSIRRGRESIWELDPGRMLAAQRALDEISREWDAALGRLKAFVETP
ncbi:ArsR/SmtB family transcription factor [Chondromyces crocatus]|uniref:ArsR family transcriptional regulator n=1 Tax=Chondromyces crocatus TaxID=52 RepID=A0A0K1ER54_CHOCO|nr:metalloregulator ArsR/SmtB family transcription factor [Chondromyces crocatus]AKT43304.1 ArsR family transcriptional regulator [Chondromyces crocatus]